MNQQDQRNQLTIRSSGKGLERDVLILVCSPLTDKKLIFEVFIGASRAKEKVCLLVRRHEGVTA